MKTPDRTLFLLTVLIWGSTWYAIKFQLGTVDPMVSVAWRFLAAGGLMLLGCRLLGVSLALRGSEHLWVLAQGVTLFSINYALFYVATGYLTSGLIAVLFSTMVVWNAFGARLILKTPVPLRVVVGGIVGFCGLALLFMPDIFNIAYGPAEVGALLISVIATLCASTGNIINARNQKAGVGLMAGNAWGMLYGGLFTLALCVYWNKPLVFEMSTAYVTSFVYLVVFGSIIAFAAYTKIIRDWGAERAAFSTLLFPIVALAISTVFEDYRWTLEAVLGSALVLLGNYMALRRV
ncbi:MAG: DMT family transporter [Litorivicinus sp.]